MYFCSEYFASFIGPCLKLVPGSLKMMQKNPYIKLPKEQKIVRLNYSARRESK